MGLIVSGAMSTYPRTVPLDTVKPGGEDKSFSEDEMSLVEERVTGKVRVVYPRKKFAIEPIFCQMEVEGISFERIAFPEGSVVVM